MTGQATTNNTQNFHLPKIENRYHQASAPSESGCREFFFSLVHLAWLTQLALGDRVKLAAILQLSQYCTFDGDSISTVITEPGQPVTSSSPILGIIHKQTKNCSYWCFIFDVLSSPLINIVSIKINCPLIIGIPNPITFWAKTGIIAEQS